MEDRGRGVSTRRDYSPMTYSHSQGDAFPEDGLVLGIESSCDEMAAAVLRGGREIVSSSVHGQESVHSPYGGVVPELASRDHVRVVSSVVSAALSEAGLGLSDLDGLAVTAGPGLVGSLLVGLSFAKALAYANDLPFVGVAPEPGASGCFAGRGHPSRSQG